MKIHLPLTIRMLGLGLVLLASGLAGMAQSRFPVQPAETLETHKPASGALESAKRSSGSARGFQFSTLPALSMGLYDGKMTFGEILGQGNFGLGTVHALDGEVIILDGKAWQIRSDGQVRVLQSKDTAPFAIVSRFRADSVRNVTMPADYADVRRTLDTMLPSRNVPYAIKIGGTFARMKNRSVPVQSKPYRPLAEVTKTQTVWEWENVKGTLVGFRFPGYLSSVNLADYHFHFLADDKSRGGHLLDFRLQSGTIAVQALRGFQLELPHTADFDRMDLSADQAESLKKAEAGQ